MVDIHSHILPGLDDGASSLEEAVAMTRMAAETGTTDIVATPHANDRYAFDPATVRAKIREVQEASGDIIRIHAGCDFHLSFSNLEDALLNPGKYTINEGPYLLVEFADTSIPPNTHNIFERLLTAGMIPVVTHPERNPILQRNYALIAQWVERDCLVQVTGDSLLGRFGTAARKSAEELMARALVHVVASDAHGTRARTPSLRGVHAHISEKYSPEHADALLTANPRAILYGKPVDTKHLKGIRRKGFGRLGWW